MSGEAVFYAPSTYADAADRADDITVDELDALIRDNRDSDIHLYPAPRRWAWRIDHLNLMLGRGGATLQFHRRAADNRTRVEKYVALMPEVILCFTDAGRVVRVPTID